MRAASWLALAALCARGARGQAWVPLVVEPCGTPASSPGQFFATAPPGGPPGAPCKGRCVFSSAQFAGACIYSPGRDNLLYLAPCNASDTLQQYSWGGRQEGGFVSGGGGCWKDSSPSPSGAAGNVVMLGSCGYGQGQFELLQSANNLTQVYSNISGLCIDTQPV